MYVAIRDHHLPQVADVCWDGLKALDVDAVELMVATDLSFPNMKGADGQPYSASSPEALAKLQADLKANGASACGLLMANDFSGVEREAQIKWVVDTIRAADTLDCQAVRIDIALRQPDLTHDALKESAIEMLKEIIAATSDSSVKMGIENHGVVSNKREFLDEVLDRVGSERLGLTLDTGNFYWYGYALDEMYKNMEHFAGRVHHTHAKNIAYPADKRTSQREPGWEYGTYVSPIYEGDIDHARVASILKAAGYTGDLCIEDESMGKFEEAERVNILKKDVAHLKEAVAD